MEANNNKSESTTPLLAVKKRQAQVHSSQEAADLRHQALQNKGTLWLEMPKSSLLAEADGISVLD